MAESELKGESHDALQYWGYLLKDDKCGTQKLNNLLAGIASYICSNFEPSESTDLSPTQLASFYRAVGGNYDILFVDTPPSSVSFIYKSLGCLQSIQPGPNDDGYTAPSIPCLKQRGFITWQTIQLLLGPEEHGPFLQNAVKQFNIVDPETGKPFPKILPKEAFPEKPDQAMLDWYESVSERLMADAEAVQPVPARVVGMASADSGVESGDERSEAASYFSNPLYRDPAGRPRIVHHSAPHAPRHTQPKATLEDRGRAAVHRVRHFWNPDTGRHRRRSLPEKQSDDYYDGDGDVTPTTLHPRYPASRPSHPRRMSQATDTDPDSDVLTPRRTSSPRRERSPRRDEHGRRDRSPRHDSKSRTHSKQSSAATSPTLRHHRSHELPTSPREQFPPHYENNAPRRHSIAPSPEPGGFIPSKAPFMAAQVAQLQQPRSPRQSPRLPVAEHRDRGSYNGRPTVRYSRGNMDAKPISHVKRTRDSARAEWEKNRSQSHDRYDYESRSPPHRWVEGTKGRRYPVESPWK